MRLLATSKQVDAVQYQPNAWPEAYSYISRQGLHGPQGEYRLELCASWGGDPGEADHVEGPAEHVPQQGGEAHVGWVVREEARALPVGDACG